MGINRPGLKRRPGLSSGVGMRTVLANENGLANENRVRSLWPEAFRTRDPESTQILARSRIRAPRPAPAPPPGPTRDQPGAEGPVGRGNPRLRSR